MTSPAQTPAEAFVWEHYCLGHTYTVFDLSRVICDCGETFGYADSTGHPWWNLNPAWQGPYLRLLDRLDLTRHVARLAGWLADRLERSPR